MTDVRIQPEFQGGPGYTAPTVLIDGEHLRDYLDMAIREWRAKRDYHAADPATRELARYYIDAFQSVRASVFGEPTAVSAPNDELKSGAEAIGAERSKPLSSSVSAPPTDQAVDSRAVMTVLQAVGVWRHHLLAAWGDTAKAIEELDQRGEMVAPGDLPSEWAAPHSALEYLLRLDFGHGEREDDPELWDALQVLRGAP